ncbi:MAG: class I SAM-dependent methyltransferase [Hyphomicrobiaceae bacterium]
MADGAGGPQPTCPLCQGRASTVFLTDGAKRYWRCGDCLLTFLDPAARLAPEAEYRHYQSHENDVDDPGYRAFLSRLAEPLRARLAPKSRGLDYGCGPGPALAHMLREAGHEVALYDPFFCADRSVLADTYDFVTCSEVAEHFFDPADEFEQFDRLLQPGGWLGLMTCFQTDDDKFAKWHYRQDPTHVVFYKHETLAFVSRQLGWQFESPAKDIVLMRKPG